MDPELDLNENYKHQIIITGVANSTGFGTDQTVNKLKPQIRIKWNKAT